MPLNNHTNWVVVTDSTTCRIYHFNKKPAELTLVKEMIHPENKLKDIELTSDKPGRYKSSMSPRSSYEQPTDPKTVKIENFSKEIAKELDHGRNTHAYNNLVIVAGPSMNGLLMQHLNKHVKNLISHTIEKDLLHLPNHELLVFLSENTQFSG